MTTKPQPEPQEEPVGDKILADTPPETPAQPDATDTPQQPAGRFEQLRKRVEERSRKAATRAGELLEKAKGEAAAAGRQGREVVGAAWARAGDATSAAIDWSRDLPAQLRDLFLRDSSVPVFLLPTGAGRDDFLVRFDFRNPVAQLEEGILVRPRLEVWAARLDVDRVALADALSDQFRSQLAQERSAALARHAERLQPIRREIVALEKDKESGETKMAVGMRRVSLGLIGMFLFANPLFDLIFLAVAFFGGREVLGRIGPWLRAKFSSAASREKLEKEESRLQRELERDLAGSSKTYQNAVANLDIRVHPVLHALVQNFAEVELESVPAADNPEAEAPAVKAFLRESRYMVKVPAHLHVLVAAHAD